MNTALSLALIIVSIRLLIVSKKNKELEGLIDYQLDKLFFLNEEYKSLKDKYETDNIDKKIIH